MTASRDWWLLGEIWSVACLLIVAGLAIAAFVEWREDRRRRIDVEQLRHRAERQAAGHKR